MKKTLFIALFIVTLISCNTLNQTTTENSEPTEWIYEPTYTASFDMGDDSKGLLIQQMHRDIINKDFGKAASYLTDDVVFALEDGSSLNGKENVLNFMKDNYSSISINDYSVAVNLTVIDKNGVQWLLLWDNGTIEAADGGQSRFSWMEAFRFDGDKIDFLNQYSKPFLSE
jgi:hypothetical protein